MATDLESRLTELLDVERFDPPAEFARRALISDDSVHQAAESDPPAWWLEQARSLSWFREPTVALDDADPPFYKWFTDGTLNASVN